MSHTVSLNAHNFAYESIRRQIIVGELAGGTKLVEERLAEQLGVSRTPVREAIRRLEQEGLIKKKRVLQPTSDDIVHLYEMLMLLEGYAIQFGGNTLHEQDLEDLMTHLLLSKNNTEQIIQANARFHDVIAHTSNNPLVVAEMQKVQMMISLFNSTNTIATRPTFINEQVKIVQALLNEKNKQAVDLLRKHLKINLRFTLELENK